MNLKEIKKHITISDGNSKLGTVPSISLPAVKTCNPKAPCTKGQCYALNGTFNYPDVKGAYQKNLNCFKSSPKAYFGYIEAWVRIKKPRLFRFHVSGDIPDITYLSHMLTLARNNPDVKFLCFTKKYNLVKFVRHNLQHNLAIIISAWPGFPLPKSDLPVAFMQDGTESRVHNAIECFGNCETCGMCWNLMNLNKNVVFHKH